MLGTVNGTRIFLCTDDTDMRKSFDSLNGIIRRSMNLDPLSGYLFVFKNKRGDRIKCIYWDETGFAMWYKVLQHGTFQFPSIANYSSAGVEIDASTMRLILDGIDLSSIRRRPRFRPVPPAERPHTSPEVPLNLLRGFSQDSNHDRDTP